MIEKLTILIDRNKVKESEEDYYFRVKKYLINWPKELIIEWLYRHNQQIDEWSDIIKNCKIIKEVSWSNYKIFTQIDVKDKLSIIDCPNTEILTNDTATKTYLSEFMLKNGTWPTPIIILENKPTLKNLINKDLGTPFHLVEGHSRLGYFRHIYKIFPEKLKLQHKVFIIVI